MYKNNNNASISILMGNQQYTTQRYYAKLTTIYSAKLSYIIKLEAITLNENINYACMQELTFHIKESSCNKAQGFVNKIVFIEEERTSFQYLQFK